MVLCDLQVISAVVVMKYNSIISLAHFIASLHQVAAVVVRGDAPAVVVIGGSPAVVV